MSLVTSPSTETLELLRKYDRPGPRYTSYPTAPMWTDRVGPDEYQAALRDASHRTGDPLALYCHIPFCTRRCYYCGCNVTITKSQERVDAYIDRLLQEIDNVSALLRDRKTVSQFHFGGGTPTYVGVEGLKRILGHCEQRFVDAADCEKSIEVDPRVTTLEQLDYLRSAGFNRISLGVQDFDDEVQSTIGRRQSLAMVENLLTACRERGFRGINLDLIYGLPRQTIKSFERTLKHTLALRPDRLAVYSFAFLPELRTNQRIIAASELPTTDIKYALLAMTIDTLTAGGYVQIGMDHFALPDDELTRAQNDGRLHRNFMGYTMQSAPDMIGLGMSSIGYVSHSFFQNISVTEKYTNDIAQTGWAVYRGLRLSPDDLIRQYVISSLMCNFTLRFDDLYDRFGVRYTDSFAEEDGQLDGFVNDGLVERAPGRIDVTSLGRTFVRNIAMTFDAYLNRLDKPKATFSRTI